VDCFIAAAAVAGAPARVLCTPSRVIASAVLPLQARRHLGC
jgi:hypothetical protein